MVRGRLRRRLWAGNQSHIVEIDFYQDRIVVLVEKTFFSMLGTGPMSLKNEQNASKS